MCARASAGVRGGRPHIILRGRREQVPDFLVGHLVPMDAENDSAIAKGYSMEVRACAPARVRARYQGVFVQANQFENDTELCEQTISCCKLGALPVVLTTQ